MGKLVCILLAVAGSLAAAESKLPKSGVLRVPGVGQVRISHAVIGEPVGQPERVEIFVSCPKKKPFRLAVFRMCIFDGYEFEEGTKTLTLHMYYGRVVPQTGDVKCDQHDMKDVELTDACQK